MLASKNWDINLHRSEKKTLYSFLFLYIFLCVGIFFLLGMGYFHTQENIMFEKIRPNLNEMANNQIKALKDLHVNIDKSKIYPKNEQFLSAIYDASETKIFSNLTNEPKFSKEVYRKAGKIYFVKELQNFYLGAKFLILEIKDNKKWFYDIYFMFISVGLPLLILFLVVGYFLLRLFLRPMKEAIKLLDRFIKDTTHELNTPLCAIMSNIEMIDEQKLDEKTKIKLKRINIGAKTVSNLYQDLVYITLGHKVATNIQNIQLSTLLNERIEYFSINITAKELAIITDIKSSFIYADTLKITKLIDNLLSNAIKYNRKNGTLHVKLDTGFLQICNSGKSIQKDKINAMFERYTRGCEEVGGFGIGLHIVAMVAKEFNIDIKVEQNKGDGTCISLFW